MTTDDAIEQLQASLDFEGRRRLEAGDFDAVEAFIRRGLRWQKRIATGLLVFLVCWVAFGCLFFKLLWPIVVGIGLIPLNTLFWNRYFRRSMLRNLELLDQLR